jgi:pseudouridine kinase
MTERERLVLEVLRENPLITQKELAKRLGIERSSVAVHIANLMKKGWIQGKGYIVQEDPIVCVIGGLNVDVVGQSDDLKRSDSSVGTIGFSAGGVARNIAEAMAKLGVPVKLLGTVGADANGEWLLRQCQQAGVDVKKIKVDSSLPTGVYMALLDGSGDMIYAVNSMSIVESTSSEYIKTHQILLKSSKYVVVDANLSSEALEAICQIEGIKCVVDPVSTIKSKKVISLLDKIYAIKPNRLEATVLTGIEITDLPSAQRAVERLHQKGVVQVALSLGPDGVIASDGQSCIHYQMPKVDVVNATGAGDVFTAGWISGLYEGLDFQLSIKQALIAAYINLLSNDTIHDQLNMDLVSKYKGEVEFYEQILRIAP